LQDFIFINSLPDIGATKSMIVDWTAMRAKYSGFRLWADDTNDATKFGSITVKRIDANSVQIQPDDYDFDLKLNPNSLQRDVLTLAQGIRAGGFRIGDRNIGPGQAFTIIVRGTTRIAPPQ
jgi:hypothetical protein